MRSMSTSESSSYPGIMQSLKDFWSLHLYPRCQKEFEKDYMESLDREKYIQDMNQAETEREKKKIKVLFEQMEMKLRRRSLGNIRYLINWIMRQLVMLYVRFIGELYKLGMLTARIMHECVKKLLMTTDEESLECLCRYRIY